MMKICPNCNTEFETNLSFKKFCNEKCKIEFHNKKKNLKTINCDYCGKEFQRPKHLIGERNFCCRECKDKQLSEDKSVIKTCEYCKKEYKIPISRKNKSKFCSQPCRAKAYAKIINKTNRMTVQCLNCNKNITRKVSSIREHNFCSIECMGEYYSKTNMFSGENSGTWNGGKKTYRGSNWLSQRRKARKRDNYTCQICGITEDEYGKELSVHHIIPFICFDDYREANKLENLICVCEPCHRKIHSGDNHPSKFSYTYKEYFG